jgi:CubicO group peptidase (beta-lactamase class C family)
MLLEEEVGLAYPAAALIYLDRSGPRLQIAVGQATLSSWFDLASLTKALCTSVLCMRLYEAGLIDLAEEVLPAAEGPGVTVAHLLSHQSGLPGWLPLYEAGASAGQPDPRAAVVGAARSAPRGPAGQRAVYSDLGFILLGDLLEVRGGDRLDRLFGAVAERLELELSFRPLGERHPVPVGRCLPTRRESPAREPLQGVVHDDNARAMAGVAGHAGLFGTVAAVARLGQALIETYHDEDTPLRRALSLSAPTVHRFFTPCGPADSTWGLGWDHPSPSASSAGSLWPRDGVGHLGFTGCSLWLDPDRRRLVALLSNRVCAATPVAADEANRRLKALRPRLHDALVRASADG